jgi:hypothetical protein
MEKGNHNPSAHHSHSKFKNDFQCDMIDFEQHDIHTTRDLRITCHLRTLRILAALAKDIQSRYSLNIAISHVNLRELLFGITI